MKKEIYISEGIGETRIAVKENGKLAEIHVDKQSRERTVGNIYKGVVENVIPGMQAAFVNIGKGNNAFLPFSEISDSELIADSKDSKDSKVIRKGLVLLQIFRLLGVLLYLYQIQNMLEYQKKCGTNMKEED